jgi:hypothetical protein
MRILDLLRKKNLRSWGFSGESNVFRIACCLTHFLDTLSAINKIRSLGAKKIFETLKPHDCMLMYHHDSWYPTGHGLYISIKYSY